MTVVLLDAAALVRVLRGLLSETWIPECEHAALGSSESCLSWAAIRVSCCL